jgi:hypothetical protein
MFDLKKPRHISTLPNSADLGGANRSSAILGTTDVPVERPP